MRRTGWSKALKPFICWFVKTTFLWKRSLFKRKQQICKISPWTQTVGMLLHYCNQWGSATVIARLFGRIFWSKSARCLFADLCSHRQSKGFLGLHQCIWLDKQKKPHSIFEKVLRDKQCNLFLIFQHFFVWKDSFEHLPGCRKLISIVIQPMDGLIHAFMLIFVHSLHLPSLSFRNQSSFLSSFLVWTKNSVNLFAY